MPAKNIAISPVSFDILSGLGQELNAPLQSLVKSSSKLLQDYKSRDFEYIAYKDFKYIMATLEVMNRQLVRCAQTTERMSQLHQIRSKVITKTSKINDVVVSVLDLLAQQLKDSKIQVTSRILKDLPAVAITNVEFHQIVYNIILNAIQAMPVGGKIKVRALWNRSKNMIQLIIEDNGVGIPPEYLERVFEPFFTTKARGVEKNSGLGLSIVHAMVRAVKGDIVIQSSLRQGTIVRIDLPVASK